MRKEQIDLAAAAIANARAGRRGVPGIVNVLELMGRGALAEVREDAEAALEAVGFAGLCDALEDVLKLTATSYRKLPWNYVAGEIESKVLPALAKAGGKPSLPEEG